MLIPNVCKYISILFQMQLFDVNFSFSAAPTGLARAIAERGLNPTNEQPTTGGPGTAPVAATQDNTHPVDTYKEQLRLQVTFPCS